MTLRRLLLALALCTTAAGTVDLNSAAPGRSVTIPARAPQLAPLGQAFLYESEPNNTAATADAIPASTHVIQGDIFPAADVDYFAFQATAGARLYAAVMTSFGAGGNRDSFLQVVAPDGVSIIEGDDDDGSFGGTASSLAGVVLLTAGTYYLRVTAVAGETLRPYHLHVRLQSGSPVPEVETNNSIGTAQPLPVSGWVAGNLGSVSDIDYYVFSVPAGATIFASLDLNPTRIGPEWNGRLGVGLFDLGILFANDAGSSTPDSEAIFMTVETVGQYYVTVDSNGLAAGSYQLSVGASSPAAEAGYCATYTSTDVPQTIPTGPGVITSTLNIPDYFVIADLDVNITLNHTRMVDLDAMLVSPSGNHNGLFTDIGTISPDTHTDMNLRLDDEAALPIDQFVQVKTLALQPEAQFRLSWFDGEGAIGDWALVLTDDLTGEGGELLSWSLTACAVPFTLFNCPDGTQVVAALKADFETGAEGFTHSGAQDEWELGEPSKGPIQGCYLDSSCWATDLDDTYNANSDQTLFSPVVSLEGYLGSAWVIWEQKYQLESASYDHASVDIFDSQANSRRLWEWRDATMTVSIGNPPITIDESAGWGVHIADISEFLGEDVGLTFNLRSDNTVQLAGLAIDYVIIAACQASPVYLPLIHK